MTAILLKSALANEPAGIKGVKPEGSWSAFERRINELASESSMFALPDLRPPTLSGDEILKRLRTVNSAVLILTAAPPPLPIRDLQLLRAEEETTDEPITHHAYSQAKAVLDYVHRMLGDEFPQPHLAPDGAGGIRMEWSLGDAVIRVVIPPRENQRRYIYEFSNRVPALKELSPVSVYHVLRSHIAKP